MTAPAQSQQADEAQAPPVDYAAAIAAAGAAATAGQVVSAYVQQAAALRQAVVSAISQSWPTLGSYTNRDVDRYLERVLPAMSGAQTAMRQATVRYLEQLDAAVAGRRPVPQPAPRVRTGGQPRSAPGGGRGGPTSPARRGEPSSIAREVRQVDPREVYSRPVRQKFVQQARGIDTNRAEANAFTRAKDIALTDLQLASTTAAQEVLEQAFDDDRDGRNIVGYRRVLTGAENCGLCIVASSVRYRAAELMPIHPNCDCVVAPIYGDIDPGRYINSAVLTGREPRAVNNQGVNVYDGDDVLELGDVLDSVHDAVESEFGEAYTDARGIDYRKVLITYDHGEYGPTLSVARHKFTRKQLEDPTRDSLVAPKNSFKTKREFKKRR